MSHFRKLSQPIWYCRYHVVFVPKYRLKILVDDIAKWFEQCIRGFCEQQKGEIIELNIQADHVHLLVMVAPKVEISSFVGIVKGRTAIRLLNKFHT